MQFTISNISIPYYQNVGGQTQGFHFQSHSGKFSPQPLVASILPLFIFTLHLTRARFAARYFRLVAVLHRIWRYP